MPVGRRLPAPGSGGALGAGLSDQRAPVFIRRRRNRPADDFINRPETRRADLQTGAAFDALILVDDMDAVFGAIDGVYRASA